MLILTRHIGESIKIDNQIEVTIVKIKGNQIIIGIEAPRNIPVVRDEILSEYEKEVNRG